MSQLSILTTVGWYLPGYKAGGPVRTIANMVESLGDEFEFRIVTSDRDLLDKYPYPGITADTWTQVGKARVYYASPSNLGILSWVRLMRTTPYDVLYLNGLFDPAFTLRPLFCTRWFGIGAKTVVLAPRGQLSPGALNLKQRKKSLFLKFAGLVGLYGNIRWHASTEDEANMIYTRFGLSANVLIARDLPARPDSLDETVFLDTRVERLRIVFLSRIARMKNLDFALRALAACATPVEFDIWGTLEDKDYWDQCQGLIQDMHENVKVRYRGAADHTQVARILAGYDLLFLPSRGENYGHVIVEAMSVGTPVLISDRTPWHNLNSDGVGWDLPLDGEPAFLKAIQEAADKVTSERTDWRRRVHAYAMTKLNDPALVEANRQVFLNERGPKAFVR